MGILSNYGCFCGKGNTREDLFQLKTLDSIDQCCYLHDLCYQDMVDDFLCVESTMYQLDYNYRCSDPNDFRKKLTHQQKQDKVAGIAVCLDSEKQLLDSSDYINNQEFLNLIKTNNTLAYFNKYFRDNPDISHDEICSLEKCICDTRLAKCLSRFDPPTKKLYHIDKDKMCPLGKNV